MTRIEEEHEQPGLRISRGILHFGDRRGIAPRRLRSLTADRHAFELRDLLCHAVLEHLDVGGDEIGDRLAADRGIHIDADVVDIGLEGLALRRVLSGVNGDGHHRTQN